MSEQTLNTAVFIAFCVVIFLIPFAFDAFGPKTAKFSDWLQFITSVATLFTLVYLYLQLGEASKQNSLSSTHFLFTVSNMLGNEYQFVFDLVRLTGFLINDNPIKYGGKLEVNEPEALFSADRIFKPDNLVSNEIDFLLSPDLQVNRNKLRSLAYELIARLGLLPRCTDNYQANLLKLKSFQQTINPNGDMSMLGMDINALRNFAITYQNLLDKELGETVKNKRQQIIAAHLL